ncbi:uncharacterized protein BKA55DRAFT_290745 [Fusarium redolens]|uniref:Uncharacterized protein n=1 Tax=Fusarium redolens TaxID=48865 RepID=A0A9P9HR17_FUSRE|nr:uncharacterized protein BKA55DRAFT_290745 [Fusarium redolens]KAH7261533.1 hypothetical protein BKA55DRAFT_290745 [Fusarium redolens]
MSPISPTLVHRLPVLCFFIPVILPRGLVAYLRYTKRSEPLELAITMRIARPAMSSFRQSCEDCMAAHDMLVLERASYNLLRPTARPPMLSLEIDSLVLSHYFISRKDRCKSFTLPRCDAKAVRSSQHCATHPLAEKHIIFLSGLYPLMQDRLTM